MSGNRPRSAIARRRLLERIELLCDCGAGLEAIASPLTHAVRDYLGCASGSLFWIDAGGNPGGFYHDSASAEIKDLFITRLDELFLAPGETNMMTLMEPAGPSIGSTLAPDYMDLFWGGNIYRYLCRPLNHHWLLDMRIELGGTGRAVYCAWNEPGRPFTPADVEALRPVQAMTQRAVAGQRAEVEWRSLNGGGHFLTDRTGARLIAINADAETVLMKSHLLRQQVSMTQQPRTAPGFAILLARGVAEAGIATTTVPVADGRIVARASATRSIDGDADGDTLISVSLDLQVAVDTQRVDYLADLPLTPLQKRIALFAMRGRARADCAEEFGVSAEALKKHLRAIFDATGTAGWTDLPRAAERPRVAA